MRAASANEITQARPPTAIAMPASGLAPYGPRYFAAR
jgi:hypothetical protein